ncbi:MAG: periplasmic heavy metal sensor [Pseudolabrys sp.]|nr:periplasmic heavy metal sensor [Pseudolabrys sp.]
MSVAVLTGVRTDRSRWLLLGSLALNLFFIGVAIAMFVRQPPPADRSISTRIERLAAALPEPDAVVLRGKYQANRAAVDNARADYEKSREVIRATLRTEPFDSAAMRAAMNTTRAARQNFDQLLQDVILAAAGDMSQAGRNRLANYGTQQNNR